VVGPGDVTAPSVAAAIARALDRPDDIAVPVDMSGAGKSGNLLMSALDRHRQA